MRFNPAMQMQKIALTSFDPRPCRCGRCLRDKRSPLATSHAFFVCAESCCRESPPTDLFSPAGGECFLLAITSVGRKLRSKLFAVESLVLTIVHENAAGGLQSAI